MFIDTFNQTSIDLSLELAEIYKELCSVYELDFIDASQFAEPCAIDGIHLDEEGHKALALGLSKKILEIF